jgi:DNA polymerase-1
VVVHTPEALAESVTREVADAAATAGRLVFRDVAVDFPLNVSVVRSYADAGKPGSDESSARSDGSDAATATGRASFQAEGG